MRMNYSYVQHYIIFIITKCFTPAFFVFVIYLNKCLNKSYQKWLLTVLFLSGSRDTLSLCVMTVTYTARVANARFCGFSKLLLAWKGSIYKVLYKEFLAFFAMYTAISITYRCGCDNVLIWCFDCELYFTFVIFFTRFFLVDDQKRYFEKLSIYCNNYASLIPMSFVLGTHIPGQHNH